MTTDPRLSADRPQPPGRPAGHQARVRDTARRLEETWRELMDRLK